MSNNTSISYADDPPTIDNSGIVASPQDTSIEVPVGTMIQRNGVNVSDEYSTLNFQGNTEEDPNHTAKVTREKFQKNGADVSARQPAVIDFLSNRDIVESPSGSLSITDEIIKKSGTSIMTGAKKYNFLGEALVFEDPDNSGEVIINLSGSGFFGDASDGDYTLDGEQESVADLFDYEGATTTFDVDSIVAATDANIIAALDSIDPSTTGYGTAALAYLKDATDISSFATNALVKIEAHDSSLDYTGNESVLMTGFLAGIYEIIKLSSQYFILRDSTFSGTYTSGATCKELEQYTLLRDAFFDDLVLTNVRLVTANFRLFARTGHGAGYGARIDNSGDVASSSGYFPTPAQGTAGGLGGIVNLPDPAAGGAQASASSAVITSLFDNSATPLNGSGGQGGAGEDNATDGYHGGTGGASRSPAATSRPTETFRGRFNLITGTCLAASSLFKFTGYSGSCGGSGGGAGAFKSLTYLSGIGGNGGFGGSNGGIMLICIRYFTGTIKIKSNGSVGENGNPGTPGDMNPSGDVSPSGGGAGGAAGGSAGAIFLFYQFKASTITTEVRGADAGWGGGATRHVQDGDVFFSSGQSGTVGNAGLVDEYQIT